MSRYHPPPVPAVDQVGAEARAAALAKRSVKGPAKRAALERIVAMLDLTTLEGSDTPARVRALCARARRPHARPEVPPVAAVCVWPTLVADARRALEESPVRVAAVATGFPSGHTFPEAKVAEARRAVEEGAHEVDMVISRGAFLAGEHARVFDEIAAVKEASGEAHLKVILETGELETLDNVRLAAQVALDAGADFLKTSTGKLPRAASLPVALVLLAAVRDEARRSGREVGVKVAGGIRTAKQAWQYLVLVKETVGDRWLDPARFRFGASTLLDDVLLQWERLETGRYASERDLALDR